jgi:hypothetical protein
MELSIGNVLNALDILIIQNQQLIQCAQIVQKTVIGVHGTLTGGDTNASNVELVLFMIQLLETVLLTVGD